jgi:hypothetical protein
MVLGLNDYEFKLNDTGVLLNGGNIAPFVDVMKVSGLDNAPYRETIRDHEGTDGGFLDAEFERGRDIVLEGVIYCDSSSVEPYLDSLKSNYAPVRTPIPFYFKSSGVNERVVFVKPRGVRFDWELARRIGMTNAQFLLYAEDPRIYDNILNSIVIPFGGSATTGFGFNVSPIITDTFTRSVSNGWGTPDVGGATSTANGSASDYSVGSGVGSISNGTLNVKRTVIYSNNTFNTDSDITIDVSVPTLTVTQPAEIRIYSRFTDVNNNYWLQLSYDTAGNIDLSVGKTVASVDTTLASAADVVTYTGGSTTHAHFITSGSELKGRVWTGATEGTTWTVSSTDGAFSSGFTAVSSKYNTGNTNTLPQVVTFDNLSVKVGFGFNLSFGTTVPPDGTYIVNSGNRPTPAVLTIAGPVTDPRIVNDTNSKTLNFLITLAGGETLTVDLANKTVLFNNTINRRDTLQTTDWFLFNPGSTFIRFGGSSGSGTLTVAYRNAWR